MAVLGNRIWYVKYVLSYYVEGNLTGKQICCYRFYIRVGNMLLVAGNMLLEVY